MNTHTPGPWHAQPGKLKGGFWISDDSGYDVADVNDRAWMGELHEGEAEANARLVAAAPALRDALSGLFQHCAMIHKQWGDGSNASEAEAAIQAARAALALVKP